jgi:hypothetical protein
MGNYVVAWGGSSTSSDPFGGVFGRRYDGAGVALGPEFQVNTQTTGTQNRPAVAADGAGNFLIVWTSGDFDTQDGSVAGVFGQRYDGAGLPLGGEFQVNTYTTGGQFFPRVAADPAGNFVVAWTGYVAGTSYVDVFAQRNKPDRLIRGKRMQVRSATGAEDARNVKMEGRETSSEIGRTIDGDPTVAGATLRVILKGAVDSDQTYVLDAAGWSALPNGAFRYRGPTGGDGDPVKRVILFRTPFDRNSFGKAFLKASLRGNVGTQSLDVVPPNPGDEGGLILQIGNGGGTYCVTFGGTAGGSEVRDAADGWTVVNATAEPGCPSP